MNAQEFGLKPGQDIFEGEYRTEMSKLREAGYTPWSTEEIMDARNEVDIDHPHWHNSFDTHFGIAGSDTNLYLMPYSKRLCAITPHTHLTNGGLPLNGEEAAVVYNRRDLILGRHLTGEEARASPAWFCFAGGSQDRLDKYVEKAFSFGNDKFGNKKMMGIFVPKDRIERAVALGVLELSSPVDGGFHLSYSSSRLVGARSNP